MDQPRSLRNGSKHVGFSALVAVFLLLLVTITPSCGAELREPAERVEAVAEVDEGSAWNGESKSSEEQSELDGTEAQVSEETQQDAAANSNKRRTIYRNVGIGVLVGAIILALVLFLVVRAMTAPVRQVMDLQGHLIREHLNSQRTGVGFSGLL